MHDAMDGGWRDFVLIGSALKERVPFLSCLQAPEFLCRAASGLVCLDALCSWLLALACCSCSKQVGYLEGTLPAPSCQCKYGGNTCDICLTSPRRKEGTSQPVPRSGLCRPSCRCRISAPVRSYPGLDFLSQGCDSRVYDGAVLSYAPIPIDSIGCQS